VIENESINRRPLDYPTRAGARVLDVAKLIDSRDLSYFHYKVLVLSWLVALADGLDLALMAYTAPYIRDEMGLTSSLLGKLLAAAVAGQILGGFVITRIADRIGRRPTIVAAALAFGLLTLATALTSNYGQLLTIRFLDGLAIGGLLPVAWALNIESAPTRRRASVVALVMFGYSVGAACAGPLANFVAPTWGWQAVYVCAGLGTLLAAATLLLGLPESVRFLTSKRRDSRAIAKTLNAIDPTIRASEQDHFILGDEAASPATFRLKQLFQGDLKLITPLLWIGYSASAFAIYLNAMWGPLLLEALKFPRPTAALTAAIGGLLGSITGLLLVRTTEHWGPRAVMIAPTLALPLLLTLGMGLVPHHLVLTVTLLTSMLLGAGHAAIVSIAAYYYPSAIRASGGGWATSIAKFGAFLGPLTGGAILSSHMPVVRTYAILAICPFILCLATLLLGTVVRRHRDEHSEQFYSARTAINGLGR
jgi:MFS transporter, AAHS family, 4-hydroxybenzoate transporter